MGVGLKLQGGNDFGPAIRKNVRENRDELLALTRLPETCCYAGALLATMLEDSPYKLELAQDTSAEALAFSRGLLTCPDETIQVVALRALVGLDGVAAWEARNGAIVLDEGTRSLVAGHDLFETLLVLSLGDVPAASQRQPMTFTGLQVRILARLLVAVITTTEAHGGDGIDVRDLAKYVERANVGYETAMDHLEKHARLLLRVMANSHGHAMMQNDRVQSIAMDGISQMSMAGTIPKFSLKVARWGGVAAINRLLVDPNVSQDVSVKAARALGKVIDTDKTVLSFVGDESGGKGGEESGLKKLVNVFEKDPSRRRGVLALLCGLTEIKPSKLNSTKGADAPRALKAEPCSTASFVPLDKQSPAGDGTMSLFKLQGSGGGVDDKAQTVRVGVDAEGLVVGIAAGPGRHSQGVGGERKEGKEGKAGTDSSNVDATDPLSITFWVYVETLPVGVARSCLLLQQKSVLSLETVAHQYCGFFQLNMGHEDWHSADTPVVYEITVVRPGNGKMACGFTKYTPCLTSGGAPPKDSAIIMPGENECYIDGEAKSVASNLTIREGTVLGVLVDTSNPKVAGKIEFYIDGIKVHECTLKRSRETKMGCALYYKLICLYLGCAVGNTCYRRLLF